MDRKGRCNEKIPWNKPTPGDTDGTDRSLPGWVGETLTGPSLSGPEVRPVRILDVPDPERSLRTRLPDGRGPYSKLHLHTRPTSDVEDKIQGISNPDLPTYTFLRPSRPYPDTTPTETRGRRESEGSPEPRIGIESD